MERKISKYLLDWKQSKERKPLILQGARQVGKTYSILEFGKENYDNIAYFNFESNPFLHDLFEESLEPSVLIPGLSSISKQTIVSEKTLVFFDEIQLCERALTSLKYFCEMAPAYHVIVAGSLLGVAVNREKFSFPVGKVDMKTMYPLDIEEFMLAHGEKELVDEIVHSFTNNVSMPVAKHYVAEEYYKKYLLVGGMPECVKNFIETENYTLAKHNQTMILESYLKDMSKYNSNNDNKKTRLVYENITVQLSRKNTRFQYKLVKSGGRASEFENAIEWLTLSGIANKIYRVESAKKPLSNYLDMDSFKVYFSDVGLLCAKKDIVPEDILFNTGDLNDFKGGMVENYVCNQLVVNEYKSYYWETVRKAEVDFIVQREGKIIPIEVKSGDNAKAKSLRVYMDLYQPEYAIKLSTKNFGFENKIKTIPLYAAFCI
ncbi:MAG: ATP-binding protein [Clostridia bacterium]